MENVLKTITDLADDIRKNYPPLAFTSPNACYREERCPRARGCLACFGLDSAPKNIDYGKDLVPGFTRNEVGVASGSGVLCNFVVSVPHEPETAQLARAPMVAASHSSLCER